MSDNIDLVKSWFKFADDDISRLLNELKVYERDLNFDDLSLDQLTAYAVETRYPDPENAISLEKTKEAILIALEVRSRILQIIKL